MNFGFFALSATLLLLPMAGEAQDLPLLSTPSPKIKTIETAHTHPPVRLTPDKSEIIRLDERAATIIVGNPAHLSVLAENGETLVLVPKDPGATHFYVLDSESNLIMSRHVIVASPKEKYVRIRNTCANSTDENCRDTAVYYCPDMCHAIAPAADGPDTSQSAGTSAQAAAQSASAMGPPQPQQAPGEIVDNSEDTR